MKKTVIISCAGKGTRLGFNEPKCLINIEEKSLIEHNLKYLENVDEIIIVVGFKGEKVINTINEINKKYNRNIKFAWNHDYENTATGYSFTIGAKIAKNDFLIALDGDLIVHPSDLKNILSQEEEFVCGEEIHTENPVYLELNEQNQTIGFTRNFGGGITTEWSGLAGIFKSNVIENKWYVYNIIEEILPAKTILIRAREVDTKKDLEEAQRWLKANYDNDKILDNFFNSRIDLKDNYLISRYSHNTRDDFDIDLIKKYINKNSTILDLGCGTGILEKRLYENVEKIVAIDKYQGFLDKAFKSFNIEYIESDITKLEKLNLNYKFDLVLLFGVTMYLTDKELNNIIDSVIPMMSQNGTFIIKNQWGINEEVIVDKYSEGLKSIYYAKYRKLDNICELIKSKGLKYEIYDIYPKEMNNWTNTHEYAIIIKKEDIK